MSRRLLAPACLALVLSFSGCTLIKSSPASRIGADSGSFQASDGAAIKAAGLELRSTRIHVDALPVMETRDGLPVINTAHGSETGHAALAALLEAFAAHGFRGVAGEYTSMGLAGIPRPVLLTSGPEAPAPSKLPVIVSPGLVDSERGSWIANLFTEVRTYAVRGSAQTNLTATYLSPNLDRIEVFASLTGGDGLTANLWVVAFDSRTGKVLWTGHASENAAVLDIAVATSLVRRLAAGLPMLYEPGS